MADPQNQPVMTCKLLKVQKSCVSVASKGSLPLLLYRKRIYLKIPNIQGDRSSFSGKYQSGKKIGVVRLKQNLNILKNAGVLFNPLPLLATIRLLSG